MVGYVSPARRFYRTSGLTMAWQIFYVYRFDCIKHVLVFDFRSSGVPIRNRTGMDGTMDGWMDGKHGNRLGCILGSG